MVYGRYHGALLRNVAEKCHPNGPCFLQKCAENALEHLIPFWEKVSSILGSANVWRSHTLTVCAKGSNGRVPERE